MTLQVVLPLLAAWIVAIVSPGPDLLMILQQAAPRGGGEARVTRGAGAPGPQGDDVGRGGARAVRAGEARGGEGPDAPASGPSPRVLGLAAAQGVMTGNLLWMTAAALGLGAVVALAPAVLPALKILGGAFLLWMGVSGLWSLRGSIGHGGPRVTGHRSTLGRSYLRGLATNLANPKALIFFTALFAPFFSRGYPVWQTVVLLAVILVVGVLWFSTFAWLASSGPVIRAVRRYWVVVEGVTSGLFALIGIAFVVNGVLSL
ncbi:LysE family translocator [Rothia sp. AR01]|uniref:LysE family translocator n=1 Tax=Rothia santali TaxID=2949643 RepID=A0A9X2KHC8_9MICC|nr:LysE family translocator [Rothia santali]MCP3424629.1 LysE family translocator [Rothia santali]